MRITPTPAQLAVERGAAWLDNMGIKDWRRGIDLDALDMRDPDLCVLGQLFQHEARVYADRTGLPVTGFTYAVSYAEDLRMPDHPSIVLSGFEAARAEVFTDDEWGYEELTQAWINYLTKENAS